MAITMQPTMAARRRILTASKGNAKPPSPVLSIFRPITATPDEKDSDDRIKSFLKIMQQTIIKPEQARKALNPFRHSNACGRSDPVCAVRKIENMISTTIPPM